jgi:hypothetical protein
MADIWADWSTTAASNSPAGADTPDDLHVQLQNIKAQVKGVFSEYTDYSAISTITGWASYDVQLIYYIKVDNVVNFWVYISGWSAAAIDGGETAVFTLADTLAAGTSIRLIGSAYDDGSANACLMTMLPGSDEITCTLGLGGGGWTAATDNKLVFGSGTFVAA